MISLSASRRSATKPPYLNNPVLFSLLLWAALLFSLPLQAAESEWSETPQAKARLLVAATDLQNGQPVLKAGLEIVLQPGWKTYWRTPGAAGIPPQIRPGDNSRAAGVTLRYPAPDRLDFQGLQLYGYENRVIFPLDLPLTPDSGADLTLNTRILICSELCIPVSFDNRIPAEDLPDTATSAGTATGISDADAAFEINRFISRIPRSAADAGLQAANLQLDPQQKRLQIELSLPAGTRLLDLFPELTPEPELDAPVIAKTGDITDQDQQRWLAQFPIQRKQLPAADQPANLVIRTSRGDFELPLNWQSAQADLPLLAGTAVKAHNSGTPAENGSASSLWLMLLMALAGGLILNLMPCVLPVLSIKVLHLIKHSELSRTQIRSSFIATAFGIISTFALLAAVLIGLKASGQAIGWGIQFQQPLFISALGLIVVIFAGNLWGLFEFRLPGAVSQLAGQPALNSHSLSGSFAQGALATLLATPCSAPFLGTAVGFAFAQNNLTLLLIFIALGVGLALPYLLMTLKPEWVHKLPKPGPWMLTLKRVLSIGLLLTAGWLFWVLSDLISLTGVALIALLALSWWLLVKRHRLFWLLPVIALAATPLLPGPEPAEDNRSQTDSHLNWQRFAPQDIAAQVADGKVVFVDITARWCVTCVANKVAVIDTAPVQQALSAPDVIAMQGDWTRPDDTISNFLNRYQRFGIPFNIVYGPGAPEGIVLSEILTQQALFNALQQARGR